MMNIWRAEPNRLRFTSPHQEFEALMLIKE